MTLSNKTYIINQRNKIFITICDESDLATCRLKVELKIKLSHFTGLEYNSYLHSTGMAKEICSCLSRYYILSSYSKRKERVYGEKG